MIPTPRVSYPVGTTDKLAHRFGLTVLSMVIQLSEYRKPLATLVAINGSIARWDSNPRPRNLPSSWATDNTPVPHIGLEPMTTHL